MSGSCCAPHMSLLAAAAEGLSMDLTDMPATTDGDLVWQDEHARPGEPVDPFATARVVLPTAQDPAPAPLDRHPAALARPVFLEGYAAEQDPDTDEITFTLSGQRLPVDTDRLPVAGPPHPGRRDQVHRLCRPAALGRRHLPAPAARRGEHRPQEDRRPARRRLGGGTTDKAGAKAEKAATDAVAVLRERAGRLLRK
ncbi:hypothetical protein GCM10020256_73100 [Streptomyces thermocoprophilus]